MIKSNKSIDKIQNIRNTKTCIESEVNCEQNLKIESNHKQLNEPIDHNNS